VSAPRSTTGDGGVDRENRSSGEDFFLRASAGYTENLDLLTPAVSAGDPSVGAPAQEETRQQVAHILASPSFRNAPLLQKFLEFITSASFEGRQEELGEYVIATQVFGRPSHFDPASDTIVRTQAYRLRTKLKEYYANEGNKARVIVDVPKGRYVPTFCFRTEPVVSGDESSGQQVIASDIAARPWYQGEPVFVAAMAVVAVILAFAAGMFVGYYSFPTRTPAAAGASVPEPLSSFWRNFVGGREIILAYTNAAFMITETDDLLRMRGDGATADRGAPVGKDESESEALNPSLAAHAGPMHYEDSFTGTGEVLAAYRLATLLTSLGAKVQVKRSRLITVNDLRDHDVVFLGSPFANQVLADMQLPQRYSFEFAQHAPYLWHARILDQKSSSTFYSVERDPQTQVIRADYALFDVLPGPAAGRRIMVLAGLTTSGTEGAAEFATSADGLRQVLAVLGVQGEQKTAKTFPRYFESLLRVDVEQGLEAINVKFVDGSAVQIQK
jgi:hypothetical protein